MTLTEAGACGTPVVASRIPGHLDAVDDGVTGVLVDDDAAMVEALTELLRDDDRRTTMGEQATRRAAHFSWDRTAHDTLAVLAAEARRGDRG